MVSRLVACVCVCLSSSSIISADVDPTRATSFLDHYRDYISTQQPDVPEKHLRTKQQHNQTLAAWKAVWHEGVGVTTFADLIKHTESHFKNGLISDQAFGHLMKQASQVPLSAGFSVHSIGEIRYILELRLHDHPAADLSLPMGPAFFEQLARDESIQVLAEKSSEWEAVLTFVRGWVNSDDHLLGTDKLPSYLYLYGNCFLEMDAEGGELPRPSIFVGLNSFMRGMLMGNATFGPMMDKYKLQNGTKPFSKAEIAAGLQQFYKLFFGNFVQMPKLRQGIEAVIEKLSKIATEWDKMNFYQFGFWLSRDVGRVRLVLEDEEDLFEPKLRNNTAEWFSRIYARLQSIGYSWNDIERPDLLSTLMPKLLKHVSNFYTAIDLGGDGAIPSKFGAEMYFSHGTAANANVSAFLDELVDAGVCTAAKREATLRLQNEHQKINKNLEIQYEVSHIKIVFEPNKPIEAKVYMSVLYAVPDESPLQVEIAKVSTDSGTDSDDSDDESALESDDEDIERHGDGDESKGEL